MAHKAIHPLEDPVDSDKLQFDNLNPRYAPYHKLGRADDVDIVKHLALTSDLREIIQSIAANGYVNVEPLIVTQAKRKGQYVVLEGNRRLAAIRLLGDPEFARDCGFANIPSLNKSKKQTLEKVYVTEVDDRIQARSLIGFKHINGPQKWEALAKAQFAKEWYVNEKKSGTKLRDIADSIGDGHSTIRRLVFGLCVLEQAKDNNLFNIDDRYNSKRIFAFSHLYTALSKAGYQKFLGIQDAWQEDDPPEQPVPKRNLIHLGLLLRWLYGSASDGVHPVIKSQNPDLRKLGEILSIPKALKTLEVKKDLEVAYLDVQPPLQLFEESLVNAHKHAEDAISRMSAYEGGEHTLLEISHTLQKNSKIIYEHLVSFHKK